MTDRIRIHDLRVHAVLGVHPHERDQPRDVRIDLSIETDVSHAGTTDVLADTVDYDILARQVHDRVIDLRAKLIETVATAAAEVCLAHPRVAAVEVTVHKPDAIPIAQSVSVTIRRVRA